MNDFDRAVKSASGGILKGIDVVTFQVNVGYLCNQECHHCHHEAGPSREEVTSWETMKEIIEKAAEVGAGIIDITGGAPEMNPHVREFISTLKGNGHHVMLRTNLTAQEDVEDLSCFLAENGVEIIASLPCYEKEETDCQRGDGVFDKSIVVLRRLNDLGYGTTDDLRLNLVFNPLGAFLPPPQDDLKEEYIDILKTQFDIEFTDLFTITNMPMGRFLQDIRDKGGEDEYMDLLRTTFNPGTIDHLMCLHQVNISWDGKLYDCDFNLALRHQSDPSGHIRDLDPDLFIGRKIVTGDHCFGCTAGSGSSCGGALLSEE